MKNSNNFNDNSNVGNDNYCNLLCLGTIHYLCLRLGLERSVYLGKSCCYPTLWTIEIKVTQLI